METQFKGKVAEKMKAPNSDDKTVGDAVAEKTNRGAAVCPNELGTECIRDHMEVIASDGSKVGVVDRVEGSAIKLTKSDGPDGRHHFLPTNWVDHVDNQVHLSRSLSETKRDWKNDAASCI